MPEPHNEETPSGAARPPTEIVLPTARPRFHNGLLITVALTAALVAGGALLTFGLSQMRRGDERQAAQEVATQLDTAKREAQQQAQQSQAASQASQDATLAEGQLVYAHIDDVNSMREELDSTVDVLKRKAKSNASARAWDRLWAERLARYRSRYAAVRAHNYRERQRYLAGRVETANSAGKLVIKYTYTPRYQSYPARPKKPAPVSVSVVSEIKRLSALQSQVDALSAVVASQAPSARAFGSVYPALAKAVGALGAKVGQVRTIARTLVVSEGVKGQSIDSSKLAKVKPAMLDAPFAELDQSFSAALAAVGLTPAQVATGSAGIQ